jgi:hypothetical protein
MSDIGIDLDGLIAFLIASSMGILLLLGITVCALTARAKARRASDRISHQPLFPHMIGMGAGIIGCCMVILLIFADQSPRPHILRNWFDEWFWLWSAAVLALWPLSVYLVKRSRRK